MKAAGVLVINDNKVLGFRRTDKEDQGVALPCGGVDPGESFADAAVRETIEETGWHVELTDLFYEEVEGRHKCLTRIYRANTVGFPIIPTHQHEGEVVWCDPAELVRGPFGEFNSRMLRHFGVTF